MLSLRLSCLPITEIQRQPSTMHKQAQRQLFHSNQSCRQWMLSAQRRLKASRLVWNTFSDAAVTVRFYLASAMMTAGGPPTTLVISTLPPKNGIVYTEEDYVPECLAWNLVVPWLFKYSFLVGTKDGTIVLAFAAPLLSTE